MLARTHIAAFALSLVLAAILTPIVRNLAHKHALYDIPDGRKVHRRPIPRLGGVAVALAFYAPLAALLVYLNSIGLLLLEHRPLLLSLFGGGAAILALGVYDDIRGADHKLKLVVQVGVAIAACMAGLRIDDITIPGFGTVPLGELAIPITIAWIVGIINAVNLIDGLDGLASGVSFFAVMTLFTVGLMDGSSLLCLATAALGGALVGFLFYNFNPASIFMGDSGSMFVGYVLSTVTIATWSKSATIVALAVPLLALGLPIFDTLLAIVRRFRTGRPVFSADRGHLHHKLLDVGLTHRQTVLFLYGVCAIFAVTALVMRATRDVMAGGVLFLAGVIVYAMIHVFRFRGAVSASRASQLRDLEVRVHEHAVDDLRIMGRKLREATTQPEAWSHLKEAARLLGVTRVDLSLHVRANGTDDLAHSLRYVSPTTDVHGRTTRLEIPLMDRRFVYGEVAFVFPGAPSVDDNRRAFMYLLAHNLVEYLDRVYGDRADHVFTVHRHLAGSLRRVTPAVD